MDLIDWKRLKHFSFKEFNDPFKMNNRFMEILDDWRGKVIRTPIKILKGYGRPGEHAPHSWHYTGRAADVRLLGKGINDHIYHAIHSPFGGVGIYAWINHKPFLHVDDRPIINRRIIWCSFEPNKYVKFNFSAVKQFQALGAL